MSNTVPPGGPPTIGFDALLASLQAAGEVTRLRLIGLLSEAELTVSELVAILGQSQPRVSRHLKLLVEAGLAERQREGAWAFYRLADSGGALARALIARVDPADPTFAADRARLAAAREARRKQAAAYFAERAADWDAIRALHAPESRVEAAIMAMVGDKPIRSLLDLGTGTGCLMLALLAEYGDASGLGVDRSEAALAVAAGNAERLGLDRRSRFLLSDWFAAIDGRFDCIVCNPPYIASGEFAGLDPEVARFEPVTALDGGADGLDDYRRLAGRIPNHLQPDGIAAFEVGAGQAQKVSALLTDAGLVIRAIRQDLGGIERCVVASF